MVSRWKPSIRTVALVLVVVASACTSGGADVTADLDTVSGDGFSVGVPAGWEPNPEGERLVPGRLLEYLPPEDLEEGTIPPQVGVALDEGGETGPAGTIDAYVALLFGIGPGLADQAIDVVDEQDVEFPGAEEARRLELEYTAEGVDGQPRVRMHVLVVRTSEGPFWDVRYAATEADFEESVATAVLDSFTLDATA